MAGKIEHLQGAAWYKLIDKLIVISKQTSKNGDIRLIVEDPETKKIYSHWCNDKEKEMIERNESL